MNAGTQRRQPRLCLQQSRSEYQLRPGTYWCAWRFGGWLACTAELCLRSAALGVRGGCGEWVRVPGHVLTRDTWVRFGARFRSNISKHWHRLVGPVPNPRKVSPSPTECGEFREGQRPNFCPSKRSMLYIGNRTFAPIPACPSSGEVNPPTIPG
jgi:hypothetical protein